MLLRLSSFILLIWIITPVHTVWNFWLNHTINCEISLNLWIIESFASELVWKPIAVTISLDLTKCAQRLRNGIRDPTLVHTTNHIIRRQSSRQRPNTQSANDWEKQVISLALISVRPIVRSFSLNQEHNHCRDGYSSARNAAKEVFLWEDIRSTELYQWRVR